MMRAKKRATPKSKIVIRKYAAQRLTMQYAELVRLRQAVRQAELLAGGSKSGSNDLRSN
jgi:hypothetical protein